MKQIMKKWNIKIALVLIICCFSCWYSNDSFKNFTLQLTFGKMTGNIDKVIRKYIINYSDKLIDLFSNNEIILLDKKEKQYITDIRGILYSFDETDNKFYLKVYAPSLTEKIEKNIVKLILNDAFLFDKEFGIDFDFVFMINNITYNYYIAFTFIEKQIAIDLKPIFERIKRENNLDADTFELKKIEILKVIMIK